MRASRLLIDREQSLQCFIIQSEAASSDAKIVWPVVAQDSSSSKRARLHYAAFKTARYLTFPASSRCSAWVIPSTVMGNSWMIGLIWCLAANANISLTCVGVEAQSPCTVTSRTTSVNALSLKSEGLMVRGKMCERFARRGSYLLQNGKRQSKSEDWRLKDGPREVSSTHLCQSGSSLVVTSR